MEDQLNPCVNLFNGNPAAAALMDSFTPHESLIHHQPAALFGTVPPDHTQLVPGLTLPFMFQGDTAVRDHHHSSFGFDLGSQPPPIISSSSSSLDSIIHPFFGVGRSSSSSAHGFNDLSSFHQETHSLVLPSTSSSGSGYPQTLSYGAPPLCNENENENEKWHSPPNQIMMNQSEFSWKDGGGDLLMTSTNPWYDHHPPYNHNHQQQQQQLSLSLSSHDPSILSGFCLQADPLPSHSTSTTTGDISLSSSSNGNSYSLSQVVSQSKYLGVIREILSDFATFSLHNNNNNNNINMEEDGDNSSSSKVVVTSSSHQYQIMTNSIPPLFQGGGSEKLSLNLEGLASADANVGPSSTQTQRKKAKKEQLLALLQMVDHCYNQSMDEIHTVISAFHAATELDPQIHACFALRTISVCYKRLKEKISNHILRMGHNVVDSGGGGVSGGSSSSSNRYQQRGGGEGGENEVSLDKSFLQKQWALQQMRRRDQLWRPQRGLPERSVSVLRAWMFQNFLHPYPKDSEKHLLAIKSGLTRSQVSNWFINARVRLWKPLIEEMYSEHNRRKARQTHDGGYNNAACNITAAAATGGSGLCNRILNLN